MGYVLPVQLDAYTQYANRVISEKERIKLDPVVKPTFYRVDSQLSWLEINKNNEHNNIKPKKEKKNTSVPAHLLAELTGKGRYVNEYV